MASQTRKWLRLGEALRLADTHLLQLGASQTGLVTCFILCSLHDNELKNMLNFFFGHCVKFQVNVCARVEVSAGDFSFLF